jgi:hypothetical protein
MKIEFVPLTNTPTNTVLTKLVSYHFFLFLFIQYFFFKLYFSFKFYFPFSNFLALPIFRFPPFLPIFKFIPSNEIAPYSTFGVGISSW